VELDKTSVGMVSFSKENSPHRQKTLKKLIKDVEWLNEPLSRLEEKKYKGTKHIRIGSNLFYNERPGFLAPLSPNARSESDIGGLSRKTSYDENYDLNHDVNRMYREKHGEFGNHIDQKQSK
jgi:hypothetical protein